MARMKLSASYIAVEVRVETYSKLCPVHFETLHCILPVETCRMEKSNLNTPVATPRFSALRMISQRVSLRKSSSLRKSFVARLQVYHLLPMLC